MTDIRHAKSDSDNRDLLSDPELWQQILDGNTAAWSILVLRYQTLVYTVANRAGLSLADVSDCFQQTWVLLHRNRNSIQDPSRLSAWLITTAKREALRLKRRSDRDMPMDSVSDPVDSADLADDALIRTERQAHLDAALEQLDLRCRRLMDLMFFADERLSYEDIAEQVGLSTNALGPARRRCLDRLRRILEKLGYLDARNGGDRTL